MKNFAKAMLLIGAVTGAVSLQAGVLKWQLNNNPNNDGYAAVAVEKTDGTGKTYLTLLDGPNGEDIGNAIEASEAMASAQYADVTNYTGSEWLFYIEMLNWDEDTDTVTGGYTSPTKYTYAQLENYVSSGSMGATTINAWTASVQIPEPTSGLLLLVGGSLLALRRRRRA